MGLTAPATPTVTPKAARYLSVTARIAVLLWIAAQIAVVCAFFGTPQYSDAANYLTFAKEAVAAGSWYPTAAQFAGNMWVANTGYINFLVANLYLFGTVDFVGIEQILLNLLLLWSIRRLCLDYGGSAVADVAVIAFCLMPSNVLVAPMRMSDLAACALLLCSLAMLRRNCWVLLVAGLLCAVGNWIRPVAALYLPAALIIALLNRVPLRYYLPFVAGLVLATAAIAGLTYSSCGYPLTGSTTKGTNMIMGCNDNAAGGYNSSIFEPGQVGYIDPELHYNAVQTDSALTARSVQWILHNPGKFVALAPSKLFRLWCADHYADKVLLDKTQRAGIVETVLMSIPYYAVLILSLFGLLALRRRLIGYAGALFLPVVLGMCMHLLMYGGMRYHYPMLPPLIFFAAAGVVSLLSRGWRAAPQQS